MVVVWLGLYFVSAKHSLAAHKVMLVVHILAQERHMKPYTNYIGHTQSHIWNRDHLRYLTSHAFHCGNAHQPRILWSFLSILLTIYVHTVKVFMLSRQIASTSARSTERV